MTLVLLCSAAGSPGVTTTAVAMTLNWPSDAALIDADRTATQAILAGYLRGADVGGRGLTALSRAHRERRPISEELLANCLPLDEDPHHRRVFLPGFSHAGSATLFQSAWPEFAENLRRQSRMNTAVIVDAGRIGDGLPGPLLAAADVTLLLTRTSLRALAATRIHLAAMQQRHAQLASAGEIGLLLVGEGDPYSSKEISQSLGAPVWGALADDAKSATVWSDGAQGSRRQTNGPLIRSITALISQITTRSGPEHQRRSAGARAGAEAFGPQPPGPHASGPPRGRSAGEPDKGASR